MGIAYDLLREFAEQGIIEALDNDQDLAAYYTSALTRLLTQATEPWEKIQLKKRIEAVANGDLPRSANGGPILILPPKEWEAKTSPKIIARIVGKDGMSPEYLQTHGSILDRTFDFIGLEDWNPEQAKLDRLQALRDKQHPALNVRGELSSEEEREYQKLQRDLKGNDDAKAIDPDIDKPLHTGGSSSSLTGMWSVPDPVDLDEDATNVGDFSGSRGQVEIFLRYSSGMYNPSTLTPIAITPTLSLTPTGTPYKQGEDMNAWIMSNLKAANAKLPKELQVSDDKLSQLGGLTKYVPHADPEDLSNLQAQLADAKSRGYGPDVTDTLQAQINSISPMQESLDRIKSLTSRLLKG